MASSRLYDVYLEDGLYLSLKPRKAPAEKSFKERGVCGMANNTLHVSETAVANFSILLPHNSLVPHHGLLPAVRQRLRHVNGSVRAPSEAWCVLRGASLRRVRASHPPVASVASEKSMLSDRRIGRSVHSESCRP